MFTNVKLNNNFIFLPSVTYLRFYKCGTWESSSGRLYKDPDIQTQMCPEFQYGFI